MSDHGDAQLEPAPVAAAASPEPDPAPAPRHQRELLGGLFLITFLIPAIGLIWGPSNAYEEGYLLTHPWQVMEGAVPHRDFFTLYGPLATWFPAQLYKVIGIGLTQERLIGIAVLAMLVASVTSLARRSSATRPAAAPLALVTVSVVLLSAQVLAATAWWWGLALVCAAGATGLSARQSTDRAAQRRTALTGLLAAAALGFRPDLIVAAVAVVALTVPPWQRRFRRPALVGVALGILPLAVHTVLLGLPDAFHRFVYVPVVQLRPTRSLPVPPSWTHLAGTVQQLLDAQPFRWLIPHPPPAGQIAAYFWIDIIIVVGGGVALWIRRAQTPRALVVFWCIGAGTITQLLQRPDVGHLVMVGAIVVPLGATLLVQLAPRSWVAPTALALLFLAVTPQLTASRYLEAFTWSANDRAAPVTRDGRTVMAASAAEATALQGAVDTLGRELSPGQTLIVGTADLSRTVRNDAGLYYLFPELVPGTYYTEMNPGITDAADSGLADEVAAADWLLLSSVWEFWSEPNRSNEHGDPRPNEIVARDFCEVPTPVESVKLYRRCN